MSTAWINLTLFASHIYFILICGLDNFKWVYDMARMSQGANQAGLR